MQVVYNSPNFSVVEYAAQDGFELIDKGSSRGTFIQGAAANKFRDSLEDAASRDDSVEAIDECLEDNFQDWMTQPLVYH